MKRLIAVLLLAIPLVTFAGGYQGAKWGMSPEEVVAAFPDKRIYYKKARAGASLFNDELLDMKVEKRFYFDKENKKLFKVTIKPLPPSKNMRKTFDVFLKLRLAMRKKYGDPQLCMYSGGAQTHHLCMSDDGMIHGEKTSLDLGTLIRSGSGAYREVWLVEDSKISLQAATTGNGQLWKELLIYEKREKQKAPDVPDIEDEI